MVREEDKKIEERMRNRENLAKKLDEAVQIIKQIHNAYAYVKNPEKSSKWGKILKFLNDRSKKAKEEKQNVQKSQQEKNP